MWLWLSLVTVVFWAVGGVLLKKGVTDLSVRTVFTINSLAFTILWLLYLLIVGDFSFSWTAFFLSIVPGLGFAYQLVAYQKAEVSLLSAIGSIHPAVTAILAVNFIGESLNPIQIGMIAGVVLGALILSWPEKVKTKSLSWVWWGLGFGLLSGVVSFIAKMGINLVGAMSFSLMDCFWILVFSLGWYLLGGNQQQFKKEIVSKAGKKLALGMLVYNIGGVAFFLAIGLGKVSLVMPVVNLYVPGLIILASWYLKEKMSVKQKIGAGVVIACVIVLSMVS
jgi:uncharacterized membrane protein